MAKTPRPQRRNAVSAPSVRTPSPVAAPPDHEGRFDGLTRLISEWVWEVDRELRLTFVSERVAAVLGFSPSEMAGESFQRFGRFTLGARSLSPEDWTSPFSDVHFETMDVEGRLRLFSMNGLPIFHPQSGEFAGAHGTAREVDGRAETASTVVGSFLSHLSHDLRTPISTIIGFSGILADTHEKLAGDQLRVFGEHIHAAGTTLIDLLDDAVDLARIDSGLSTLSKDALDLVEVLAESLAQVRPKADLRQVSLEDRVTGRTPIPVRADRLRLRKIVQKLLMKALQGGTGQGRVEVDGEPIDAAFRLCIAFVATPAAPNGAVLDGGGGERSSTSRDRKAGKVLDAVSERVAELMNCRLGCLSETEGSDTYWIEIPSTCSGTDVPAPE